jgi:prefoldin subunit 5
MDKATAELDKKETEYQNNVTLISQKSKDLEKRHREIDTEVEAPKAK